MVRRNPFHTLKSPQVSSLCLCRLVRFLECQMTVDRSDCICALGVPSPTLPYDSLSVTLGTLSFCLLCSRYETRLSPNSSLLRRESKVFTSSDFFSLLSMSTRNFFYFYFRSFFLLVFVLTRPFSYVCPSQNVLFPSVVPFLPSHVLLVSNTLSKKGGQSFSGYKVGSR